MFTYPGSMCGRERKAGISRQRLQFSFLDVHCSFVRNQACHTGWSWRRSGQMTYTAWNSKDRVDWAEKEEKKLEAQESIRYYAYHSRIPTGGISLGGRNGLS